MQLSHGGIVVSSREAFFLQECVFVCTEGRIKMSHPFLGNSICIESLLFVVVVFVYSSPAAFKKLCLVLLIINVFFYPSLWRKLCLQSLGDGLNLPLVANMRK